MRHKLLFAVAILGILAGLVSAYVYRQRLAPQPPLAASRDPYQSGIYAEGIIQSAQASGDDVNVYPEVAGTVTRIDARDGETVARGAPLLAIDDAVQRKLVAADVAKIAAARAALVYQRDQLSVLDKEAALDARAVSRLALVTARDNVDIARQNLRVAIRTRAVDAALLGKYVLRAPVAGTVARAAAAVGAYVSAQGVYDPYSQGLDPVVVMERKDPYLQVKAYLDELLVPRMPPPARLTATMFVRGANVASIPLQFVRIQPYVTPKIELSDQRQEKVDVRVLPIIFRFEPPKGLSLYPGELVDVYVAAKR